jgi:hypothetical protein
MIVTNNIHFYIKLCVATIFCSGANPIPGITKSIAFDALLGWRRFVPGIVITSFLPRFG